MKLRQDPSRWELVPFESTTWTPSPEPSIERKMLERDGAEVARATSIVRTSLIVEVEDVVWQRQLNTLRHFLLRNLAEVLGEPLITEIDFRPMPRRIQPQRAEAARPGQIEDPVLDLLYRQSRNRNSA